MKNSKWIGLAAVAGFVLSTGSAFGQDNGVFKGKVVFKGNADNYKRTLLDTNRDPNCKKSKARIGSYDVILNTKTDPITIRNVIVHVKDGLGDRTFPVPNEKVILTQVGCEYEPHVMALMEGQILQVLNGDETNHNIHFQPQKNEAYNFTQPRKDTEVGRELKLVAEPTPFKVKCDVHPWMGAYIGVFKHPFFAVTGDDGTFEIKGLPPGKYSIVAWHESFGEQKMDVEIASGAAVEKDFTFEPK